MACLSVILFCYRVTCLWFCNKDFIIKRGVICARPCVCKVHGGKSTGKKSTFICHLLLLFLPFLSILSWWSTCFHLLDFCFFSLYGQVQDHTPVSLIFRVKLLLHHKDFAKHSYSMTPEVVQCFGQILLISETTIS